MPASLLAKKKSTDYLRTYLLTALFLCGLFYLSRNSQWKGSTELHTIMEVTATTVAFMVGAMALVRFHAKKDNIILFIGAGFLGTAFLDGYHALVTSNAFSPYLPSDLPALIPWSWVASRFFLSLLLCCSWLVWEVNQHRKKDLIIKENYLYIFVAALTLLSFVFFAFAPLPRAYYPEFFFGRPEEFIPAFFFSIALVGYLRKGDWRTNIFEHWLVLALIVNVIAQVFFMSFSFHLFDFNFDMAHFLKKISYILVLIGLFLSMYHNFRDSERNERRIRTIFETVDDAIITTDYKGNILAFNQGAERIFGHTPVEIIGQNIKSLMPDNFAEGHDGHMKGYQQKTGISHIGNRRELQGLRKDGSVFPLDLTINDNIDVDGQTIITGIARDITKEKESSDNLDRFVQKLEKTNDELEKFAYIASHDLKAPLRGIDNLATFIREDLGEEIEPDIVKSFDLMQNRIKRMEKLLNDLLEYSRAGTGDYPLKAVNLSKLFTNVITLLSPPDTMKIDINCNVKEINTAQAPLLQVLMNIIGNAIKHHDKKDGKITIDVTEKKSHIEFSITDDGAGIPQKFHTQIFQMFQTLKPRDEVEGSGMGLAIVTKITKSLGGDISILSEDGKRGCCFIINWPKIITHDIL